MATYGDNREMSVSQEQLFESVLSLPQPVRAHLAFELLQSLDPPAEEIAAHELGAELQERIAAYRCGELRSFSLEEVRAVVQAQLSQKRGI